MASTMHVMPILGAYVPESSTCVIGSFQGIPEEEPHEHWSPRLTTGPLLQEPSQEEVPGFDERHFFLGRFVHLQRDFPYCLGLLLAHG